MRVQFQTALKMLLVSVVLVAAVRTAVPAQRRGQSPFPNVEDPSDGQRRGARGTNPQRGRGPVCEPSGRIQKRTYSFKEIDKKGKESAKKMEYDVFVSTKANRNEKSPLVIGLHGRGV